tara:strand:+ start:31892 stop:33424 length:1533 start_codon:yes stop_codon:yes gene_type:complete
MIILVLFNLILSQGIDINQDIYDKHLAEFNIIEQKSINESLYLFPLTNYKKNKSYNFFDNIDNIDLFPVMGFRYSSNGFEINQQTPSSVVWFTPGAEFTFNKIILNSISNPIWFNGLFSFYKHSAYGLDNDLRAESSLDFNNLGNLPIFLYNPNYQYAYFRNVKNNNNGIDFDETTGYISVLSKNADLIIGKFRSSLGPSSFSNLSISNSTPAFNQIRFRYNHKNKVHFTFLIGDLYSNLIDTNFVYQYEELNDKYAVIPKKIFNHRIDFTINENFRLGFYEQIIGKAKNSILYYNPFSFYWSDQHQNGDLDNLQIGFDFDYVFSQFRFYGGLLIDEWAFYDTFNEQSKNWFARQIGFSKIFNSKIINSNIKGIVKFEYSDAEPQVYSHKFPINTAYHHNYPIGLWSGGDSIDNRLSLVLFVINNISKLNFIIDFSLHATKFGQANYNSNASLLSNGINKSRNIYSINFKKTLYNGLDYHLKVGYYVTENLYSEDNFLEFSTSLLYNIQR